MNRHVPLIAVVALALVMCLSSSAWAALEDKISLDFKDTDIREVIKLISTKAGIDMIAEKSVRGNVSLRLTDVPAETALDIVAHANGFSWMQYQNTIIVADERKLHELAMDQRFIPVVHQDPSEIAKIVAQICKKDIRIATADGRHGLVLAGPGPVIDTIAEMITTLDQPSPTFTARLEVILGDAVLHSFEFSGEAAMALELKQKLHGDDQKVHPGMNAETSFSAKLCTDKISTGGNLSGSIEFNFTYKHLQDKKASTRKFAGQFSAQLEKPVKVFSAGGFLPIQVVFTWLK